MMAMPAGVSECAWPSRSHAEQRLHAAVHCTCRHSHAPCFPSIHARHWHFVSPAQKVEAFRLGGQSLLDAGLCMAGYDAAEAKQLIKVGWLAVWLGRGLAGKGAGWEGGRRGERSLDTKHCGCNEAGWAGGLHRRLVWQRSTGLQHAV